MAKEQVLIMCNAIIYGFGSFFNKSEQSKDIDILVIHKDTSYNSCKFAITCKRLIKSKVSNADVTLLSKVEENQLSFISKSNAVYLGEISNESLMGDLDAVLTSLQLKFSLLLH